MWTVESELDEAFSVLKLPESDIKKCSLAESTEIQHKAMCNYVEGNPRSWWMGLTQQYVAYDYDFPSEHILEHIPSDTDRVWWIPETEKKILDVYDTTPEVIVALMELTASFEYYVLAKDFSWLVIETDHGELWLSRK